MSVPALHLVQAPDVSAASVAILPGGFNPPTRAHVALAESALARVDAVLFVLPRTFPHKSYEGAGFEHRLALLERLAASNPRFGVAVSHGGLYVEIVRETKAALPQSIVYALCGRDAAERIISWDYGIPNAIEGMLREFRLLVAARQGEYQPPDRLRHAVENLPFDNYDECSSSAVREEIERQLEWRHLAPSELHQEIERIYSALPLISRNARSL
ncbi:MAG: hypothetical protein WKF37_17815 [Bryobacteraceae bacterium]